jgi:hypothetical protein
MESEQDHSSMGQGSGREITIIVNAESKTVTQKKLTFDQVVSLAYDGNPPTGPDIVFTVTYRKGDRPHHEGTMVEGDSVPIKDGMIFNVTPTTKS